MIFKGSLQGHKEQVNAYNKYLSVELNIATFKLHFVYRKFQYTSS